MHSAAMRLSRIVLFCMGMFALISVLLAYHLPGTSTAPTPPMSMPSLPQPRAAALRRCPVEDDGDNAAIHAQRGQACKFIVRNEQLDNVELLFVMPGPKEEEKRYHIVDFNSSVEMESFTGDKWRLRSRHGVLLKAFPTPVCLPTGPPEVRLPPCAGPGDPAPIAPAAPLAVRRSFTGERLRACGSDLVLSSVHLAPGMHLLCLRTSAASSYASTSVTLPPSVAFAAALFAHGRRGAPPTEPAVPSHVFFVPAAEGDPTHIASAAAAATDAAAAPPSTLMISPENLISLALAELERRRPPSPHQPAALFTLGGARLESADDVARAAQAQRGLLLFEGGQWLWPAAHVGQEHAVHFPPVESGVSNGEDGGGGEEGGGGGSRGTSVRLRVLSVRPRVLQVDDFLTDAECEHIIGLSSTHMFASGVAMKADDAKAGHSADEYRTSTQYSLAPSQTDVLLGLSRRVQLLTRLPITHVEQIQVLRYLTSQHYSAHHDFFDPGDYGSATFSNAKERGLASNRLATVFFYLNDVEEGGETGFPRAGGGETPRDFRACHQPGWLNVRPRKRRVVIFYSMLPSGEFDHYSLHAGCDVGQNFTKWAANFWIWNTQQMSTLLHPSLRAIVNDLRDPETTVAASTLSATAAAATLAAELGVDEASIKASEDAAQDVYNAESLQSEPRQRTRFDRY